MTTFGEGPTVIAPKGMNEPMTPMTWQDIRFTTKGTILYAICLGVPEGEVKITSLASRVDKIKSVELLGSSDKIDWKATPEGLVIEPSSKWPCDHAVSYRLTMK